MGGYGVYSKGAKITPEEGWMFWNFFFKKVMVRDRCILNQIWIFIGLSLFQIKNNSIQIYQTNIRGDLNKNDLVQIQYEFGSNL